MSFLSHWEKSQQGANAEHESGGNKLSDQKFVVPVSKV